MWKPILAISLGAALGAVLRWVLGTKPNSLFPTVLPGTLAANLIGGYIIGIAVAYFAQALNIAPERRLLIVTGFCGGLTTFSTFSADVVTLTSERSTKLGHGRLALHVTGSLAMTLAGLASWHLIKPA